MSNELGAFYTASLHIESGYHIFREFLCVEKIRILPIWSFTQSIRAPKKHRRREEEHKWGEVHTPELPTVHLLVTVISEKKH